MIPEVQPYKPPLKHYPEAPIKKMFDKKTSHDENFNLRHMDNLFSHLWKLSIMIEFAMAASTLTSSEILETIAVTRLNLLGHDFFIY